MAEISRRTFLARTGVLAAALATGGLAWARPAEGQAADDLLDPLLEGLDPILQALTIDTISGMSAFVVPGTDPYSVAQGLTDPRPGGVAAENPRFMLDALDKKFLPIPDTAARSLAEGFLTSASAIPLPAELVDLLQDGADGLDDLVLGVLENDHVVPTALVIAMYFNFAASLVNPASVVGTFISPFANLAFEEKGAAFAMIEEQHADLVQGIDSNLPEPLDESVSGLLHFVPGALLEFIGFGTYSEFHQLDRSIDPLTLQGRPVGWEISGYQEGLLTAGHGWDELLGYHKGVRAVEGSWDNGEGVLDRA